jgi:hypothetical protein
MKKSTSKTSAPNAARGEASITIAGQQYPIRFSLNVLRDWTKLSGRAASEFGLALVEDHIEAFSGIITCAVRRFVPPHAEFTQDAAIDLLDEMSQPEADALAKAIMEATTTVNPLLAAMSRQLAVQNQAAASPETPAEVATNS